MDVQTSLWRSRGMLALVGIAITGFASYFLTLASLPAYAVTGGASVSTAGTVTAVLLVVTVLVQLAVPALTARFGLARVLVAGLLALGLPSPFYMLHDGLLWLSALSAVRGAGFAVLTVLGSTMAARVASPERRGESIGIYGLAIALPSLVAVPAGVALVFGGEIGWLSWLAASPVLGLLFVPTLVRLVGSEPPGAKGSGRGVVRAALAPSVVLFVVTMAGGGLVTFLPIERPDGALATMALLLYGITGAISRWGAGMLADRRGGNALMVLSLVLCAVGIVGGAAGLLLGDAWILVGAAVFGLGYGAAQNLTLLSAFARAGEGGTATAASMWNVAFDGGTATGALVLGFVVAGVGLPWTFLLVAALLMAVVPAGIASAAPRAVSGSPADPGGGAVR